MPARRPAKLSAGPNWAELADQKCSTRNGLRGGARQIILGRLLNKELDRVREMTEAAANAVALPKDLRARPTPVT
jgi:hypothetical protein